jgi:hypothetical protein
MQVETSCPCLGHFAESVKHPDRASQGVTETSPTTTVPAITCSKQCESFVIASVTACFVTECIQHPERASQGVTETSPANSIPAH